jgi:hypothetical protein
LKIGASVNRVRLEVGENGIGEFRRGEIRDPKEIRRQKTEEVSGIQVHSSKNPEHPSAAGVPPSPESRRGAIRDALEQLSGTRKMQTTANRNHSKFTTKEGGN